MRIQLKIYQVHFLLKVKGLHCLNTWQVKNRPNNWISILFPPCYEKKFNLFYQSYHFENDNWVPSNQGIKETLHLNILVNKTSLVVFFPSRSFHSWFNIKNLSTEWNLMQFDIFSWFFIFYFWIDNDLFYFFKLDIFSWFWLAVNINKIIHKHYTHWKTSNL